MDAAKRKRLESAGYELMDAEDFLELADAERRAVELRVALARAVRDRRTARNLSQQGLAELMASSQSRVAKMEAAAGNVSLDLLFRGLFVLGGGLEDLQPSAPRKPRGARPGARVGRRTRTPAAKAGAE